MSWWATGFNTAVPKDSLEERRMEKKKKRPPSPIPRQGNLRRARPLRRIQNHVCVGGTHTQRVLDGAFSYPRLAVEDACHR